MIVDGRVVKYLCGHINITILLYMCMTLYYSYFIMNALHVSLLYSIMYMFVILLVIFVVTFPLHSVIYKVAYAFGTVGLSQGITPYLTTFSKIILMIFMFIGRIGLVTFLLTFRDETTPTTIRYPKERIMIG